MMHCILVLSVGVACYLSLLINLHLLFNIKIMGSQCTETGVALVEELHCHAHDDSWFD